ncbi:hypothetical protein EJ04DRAFT_305043 [Polyplosphaeria fusca]|uniref:Rhodopsin domain-containing protein n=1 Tax=Polyplosphaeria fusca TaxID=682080 RepID=A0A9P4QX15_9PLEO|nr:hypothetical protein EJ04DRAFT_305043 [Polyplosphaeria fusca]
MAYNNPSFTLDPEFAPRDEKARQNTLLGVTTAFTLIGMITVALRIYTRAHITRNMGMEDWTMIAAAVLTFIFWVLIIVGARQLNWGFSFMSLSASQMETNGKFGLAVVPIYKATVALIKMSILFIYLRLAVNNIFRRLCQGTIVLLAVWTFIVVVVVLAQCQPLSVLWDYSETGKCIDINTFYFTTSGFHVLVDLWILVLPIRLFLSIPRPTREKLALLGIFGLGILSTLASIVRLYYLKAVIRSTDPFYAGPPLHIASMVEINIGILCACLPTLKPLLSKTQRARTRQALKYGSDGNFMHGTAADGTIIILHQKTLSMATTETGWSGGMVGAKSEEYELGDRPPPVPPKDLKMDKSMVPSYSKEWMTNAQRAYPEKF